MPLEPELEAIFNQDPRFAEVLRNYERNGTSDPRDSLRTDPAHGGVTDEALTEYLDRFYPPRNPQFREQFRAGDGRTAPPPGGMEDQVGDGAGQGGTPPPPAPSPPASEPDPSLTAGGPPPVQAPPSDTGAEGGPPAGTQPPAGDPFRPDSQIDPRRLAAWQEFDRSLQSDRRLQAILYNYATTGRIPAELLEPPASPFPRPSSAPVGGPPSSAGAAPPDLTPPPDLDMADPAVRAMWDRFVKAETARYEDREQFNAALQHLNQRIDTTSEEFQSRVEAENDGLVARVTASFARQHGLDGTEARRILTIAENLGVAQHYMTGIDPITMMPVRPDPMAAVERALEVAYNQDPIAQERERQRYQAAEKARIQADQDRRRKLAGVGGGSGATPRQPAEPQSKEERTGAAVEWLRSFMNGTPEGGTQ